jgi:hypothetical protein
MNFMAILKLMFWDDKLFASECFIDAVSRNATLTKWEQLKHNTPYSNI